MQRCYCAGNTQDDLGHASYHGQRLVLANRLNARNPVRSSTPALEVAIGMSTNEREGRHAVIAIPTRAPWPSHMTASWPARRATHLERVRLVRKGWQHIRSGRRADARLLRRCRLQHPLAGAEDPSLQDELSDKETARPLWATSIRRVDVVEIPSASAGAI
ncbi:hypothetical protein FKP32DRAFT_1285629 [Trametes sanguinea]|nr:hypothetical protein FKP32DRAFT_1285629 [Trametes sanguinea]